MALNNNAGGGMESRNSLLSSNTYKRKKLRPMSDINVTPMVDIMLVLLIVFMVSAPLLTTGVPVNLPKVSTSTLSESKEPLTVSINKDGEVFIQNSKIEKEKLVKKLLAISKNNREIKVYIRADQQISYGIVMDVMAILNKAGFTKVALITKSLK